MYSILMANDAKIMLFQYESKKKEAGKNRPLCTNH